MSATVPAGASIGARLRRVPCGPLAPRGRPGSPGRLLHRPRHSERPWGRARFWDRKLQDTRLRDERTFCDGFHGSILHYQVGYDENAKFPAEAAAALSDALWVIEPSGDVLWCNPAAQALGPSLKEKNIREFFVELQQFDFDALSSAIIRRESVSTYARARVPDQATDWFRLEIHHRGSELGAVVRARRLSGTEQQARSGLGCPAAFQKALDPVVGIWHVDATTDEVTWSQRMREIMGIDAETLVQHRTFMEAVHPDDRPLVVQAVTNTLVHGLPYSTRCRLAGSFPDGERTVEAFGAAVRDQQGRVLHYLGGLIDVSAQARAESRSAIAESRLARIQGWDSMSALSAGLAHDLNNLLTVIQGNASIALEELEEASLLEECLSAIMEASVQASDVTAQLLTVGRHRGYRPVPVHLAKLVRASLRTLTRLISKEITISIEDESHGVRVVADAGQIHQVLVNLVVNAAQAMPGGGSLHVLLRSESGFGVVVVQDSGAGVRGAAIERLFEPFFSTTERGLGLGLSIARQIVTRHRGELRWEDSSDQGARFVFSIPLAEPGKLEATPKTSPRGRSRVVLVAEDQPLVRRLAARILERENYRVLEAPNGRAALELFGSAPHVDLMLVDLIMPDLGAREMVSALRDVGAAVPVLFMSGYPREFVAERGLDPEAVVRKPFEPVQLLRAVASAIRAS